jgi:hypothetical protein
MSTPRPTSRRGRSRRCRWAPGSRSPMTARRWPGWRPGGSCRRSISPRSTGPSPIRSPWPSGFSARPICGAATAPSASTVRGWCRSPPWPAGCLARATATCRRQHLAPRRHAMPPMRGAIWCSGRVMWRSLPNPIGWSTPTPIAWRWRSRGWARPSRGSRIRAAGRRPAGAALPVVAHRGGFEPPTPRFVVWCSIQLSYRCPWRSHIHRRRAMQSRPRS